MTDTKPAGPASEPVQGQNAPTPVEPTATCPNCHHEQHLPGDECEAMVFHGTTRQHRCLCLARPGAARMCPPQMDCQGGTLGYTDIGYLQRGHSLSGANRETITPDVLKTPPAAVPSAPADRAVELLHRAESYLSALHGSVARHDNLAANLGCAGCELRDQIRAQLAAVVPPAVDRTAVLHQTERDMLGYALDLAQEQMHSRSGEFTVEDQEAVDALRRMADEEQQPEAQAAAVSPTAALLASRCDTCLHTLNRHTNYAGCTVVLCVCGRFQPPADEPSAATAQPGKEA